MTRHDRGYFVFAAILSLLLHAAVLYATIGVTLGLGRGQLFAAAPAAPPTALRVTRDPKDLYLEEDPLEQILDPEQQAVKAAEDILKAASELIEKVEPVEAAPPVEPAEAPKATDPEVAPELPAAAPTAPGGSQAFDATHSLLALAQPAVTLPEFVAPADPSAIKLPESGAGFGADFDPGRLDALLSGTSGSGTGTGAARAVAPAPAPAPPPPPAPVPEAPKVAKATPPPPPPLPEQVAPAALPVQDKQAVHLDEDFDYQLLTYVDPPRRGLFGGESEPEDGYFEARLQPRRSLRRLSPLKKDVVYAIDTSDSITSKWIEPIRRGVALSLDNLNEGDRFNIVLFKDQAVALSQEGLLDATAANIAAARQFLSQAEASGYTDVNRALGRLLVRNVAPDRVYQIILLSDGRPTRGATDPHSIINLITRENDLIASIYCVGTGDVIKRELLQYIAYRNKGFVVYPESAWKVQETIADLAARLRYPIVKDATFAAIGVDGASIYPRIPRDIYQSDPVSLFGRFSPDAQKLSMRLTGTNGAQRLDITFTLDFGRAEPGSEQLMQNWAFWKLHHLYSETIRQGETKDLQRQIEDLKKKYRIRTAY